ncbi:molybdopterin synthase [Francisella halioticida]|uniref:molybdenum cofactor biosynthesis protein MoaE n=1 Tax=Francisella halioticida TaxID=549298 RepID=UPI001AF9DC39|nr:molybdenum cofactor biosynthesis protein MoaE [Francisella halioticida]BCD92120.1 molybdopterin synthase [Francisella halioticida]
MKNKNSFAHITNKTIAITDAEQLLKNKEHGATIHFIGVVRDHNEGKKVTGIDYDVCRPLAKNVLNKIIRETEQRYPKICIYIAHYEGYLNVGEISLLISTSTSHRDDCYKANRYIVEAIKHSCPVWKREHYVDGKIEWVKGCVVKHEYIN